MPDKITRLVFSGGGARGIVYPGAYAALLESGVFEDVKDVTGSSAGAFTAAMLAIGMSANEFRGELMKTKLSDLLGEKTERAWIMKDGKPLYDVLRNTINNQALTFLQSQNLNDSHACWALIQKLEHSNQGLTFGDLDKLIKSFPKRFKQLTIAAVKENGGDLKIFNTQDTPDVEIALACRASGAIPLVLAPVEIDGVKYIDGGVHDNIPTESFDKDIATNTYKQNKYPNQTLVFAFMEDDKQEKLTTTQQIMSWFAGSSSVFNLMYGSRRDEHDNLELFKKLLTLVETELANIIVTDIETPLEQLIDKAVDSVKTFVDGAVHTVSENIDWSWLLYVYAVIVVAIVAIWNFIRSFFPASTPPAPQPRVANDPKMDPVASTTYLTIIRNKLKEAIPPVDEKQTESKEDVEQLCVHAKKTVCHKKVHATGPSRPPNLFDRHPIEAYAYNHGPKLFGSFKSDYRITDKMEESFQRLRSHYPLRTVGLGIGKLSPIDFEVATQNARVLSARGYLHTMNTILNHNLHRKGFTAIRFYIDIVESFIDIYEAVLTSSGKNTNEDPLFVILIDKTLNDKPLSPLSLYYMIMDEAELDYNSDQAFALTRAVELRQKELTEEQLTADVTARCQPRDQEPTVTTTSNASFGGLLFSRRRRRLGIEGLAPEMIARLGQGPV